MRKFKGGGGSAQPADQKVYSTDLPEYVEPYFKRLLQRGEAESLQGYTPYGGQRLAYFSPDELQSQAMVRGFAEAGTPQEFTDASTAYGQQGSVSSGFTQGDVTSGYTAPVTGPTVYSGATGGPGRSYTAPTTGPVTYGGGSLASGYTAGTFDPGYFAQTRASQYATPDAPGQFTPLSYEENIQRFMSPYQQNVIDIQKREAKRQSDIAASKIQDAATASGGLGGYREAIMQAERERNLGQQLDDIQQRGSQAAFESAQQQLERERASGVTGAQLGLQRFGALQSAAQSQEQLAQQAFNAGQAARQQAAQLGLSAQQQAEAARQAQEKVFKDFRRYNKLDKQQERREYKTFKLDNKLLKLQGRKIYKRFKLEKRQGSKQQNLVYLPNRLSKLANRLKKNIHKAHLIYLVDMV